MEKPGLVGERYTILQSQGEDKIGPVSLARDEVSGSKVVLRALPSEIITDTAAMERLEREITRLSGLDHGGIVSSYEFCCLRGSGQAFLVSEYINGQTLRGLLSSDPECFRDEKYFRMLAEQILSAVDYAHQRRITHRDLTSDNVLLTPDDRIKILDFGIDAVISEFRSEVTKKRSWATRKLSFSEMDVERAVPIDIYTLGKLFHEMLSGESLPSERRREEEFLPVLGISAGLNLCILNCLNKEISERPESVRKILEMLLEGRSLRPEMIDESIADLRARRELSVAGSVGKRWSRPIGLASLLLAMLFLWQWTVYDRERTDHEVEKEELEGEAGVSAQASSAPEPSASGRVASDSRPPEAIAAEQPTTQENPGTSGSYTVQVGAFGVLQSAQDFISRLRELGYEARAGEPGARNRLYPVWIGRYESVRAASGMQKRLESAGFHTYVRRVEENPLERGSR